MQYFATILMSVILTTVVSGLHSLFPRDPCSCPAYDTDFYPLGSNTGSTGSTLRCYYPSVSRCQYSLVDGSLIRDSDSGYCPDSANGQDCPSVDTGDYSLGPGSGVHNSRLYCAYPTTSELNSLRYYCEYSLTNGTLSYDNDDGYCPSNANGQCNWPELGTSTGPPGSPVITTTTTQATSIVQVTSVIQVTTITKVGSIVTTLTGLVTLVQSGTRTVSKTLSPGASSSAAHGSPNNFTVTISANHSATSNAAPSSSASTTASARTATGREKKLTIAIAVGSAIGGILFLLAIVIAVIFSRHRRKSNVNASSAENMSPTSFTLLQQDVDNNVSPIHQRQINDASLQPNRRLPTPPPVPQSDQRTPSPPSIHQSDNVTPSPPLGFWANRRLPAPPLNPHSRTSTLNTYPSSPPPNPYASLPPSEPYPSTPPPNPYDSLPNRYSSPPPHPYPETPPPNPYSAVSSSNLYSLSNHYSPVSPSNAYPSPSANAHSSSPLLDPYITLHIPHPYSSLPPSIPFSSPTHPDAPE